jgi:hypothetical protein
MAPLEGTRFGHRTHDPRAELKLFSTTFGNSQPRELIEALYHVDVSCDVGDAYHKSL